MMRIQWSVRGRAGEGYAFRAEDAANAVEHALRAAYPDPADTERLAHVLWSVWGPLRMQIITSGERTVAQGGTWVHSSEGISVTLCPVPETPPTFEG